MEAERNVIQVIPKLKYEDDMVFKEANRDTLEELTELSGEEGDSLGLSSRSDKKSYVMIFNDERTMQIADKIKHVWKYKHLGLCSNKGRKYLEEHEENLICKGKLFNGYETHGTMDL